MSGTPGDRTEGRLDNSAPLICPGVMPLNDAAPTGVTAPILLTQVGIRSRTRRMSTGAARTNCWLSRPGPTPFRRAAPVGICPSLRRCAGVGNRQSGDTKTSNDPQNTIRPRPTSPSPKWGRGRDWGRGSDVLQGIGVYLVLSHGHGGRTHTAHVKASCPLPGACVKPAGAGAADDCATHAPYGERGDHTVQRMTGRAHP